ncbi:MAG TPA: PRC-barrel domain-containing protein [Devosia sp.]|jgi:sporulation protein YlmC with PRC-barrel domain|nr:PRC-barrel domain-containing protein [Devosia sp.]
MRLTAFTATAVLALTTVSFAQADWIASQAEWMEQDDEVIVQLLSLTVEELEDRDLYDAAGREIGEVKEVIGLSDGTVIGLAVEIDDYAGIEDYEQVVVPIDRVSPDGERLTTDLTVDELRALPQWDD